MTREDAIEKLKAIVPRQDHDGYKIKPSVLVDSLESLGLITFAKAKKSPNEVIFAALAQLSSRSTPYNSDTLVDSILENLKANGYRIVTHDPS